MRAHFRRVMKSSWSSFFVSRVLMLDRSRFGADLKIAAYIVSPLGNRGY